MKPEEPEDLDDNQNTEKPDKLHRFGKRIAGILKAGWRFQFSDKATEHSNFTRIAFATFGFYVGLHVMFALFITYFQAWGAVQEWIGALSLGREYFVNKLLIIPVVLLLFSTMFGAAIVSRSRMGQDLLTLLYRGFYAPFLFTLVALFAFITLSKLMSVIGWTPVGG